MKLNLAHGRNQLPFSTANITVSTGGTTTVSRTLYFSIQGQNYVGLNLNSAMVGPVTIAAGQKVSISPPALLSAEGWINYVVSASVSALATDLVQLGKIPVLTPGGEVNTLPLVLSNDASLSLSVNVATVAALPVTSTNGMMRGVLDESAVYEYDAHSATWVKSDRLFNTYIADTTKIGGCAQDVRYFTSFNPPTYLDDNSQGTTINFWMLNDGISPQSSGKRLGMVVKLNEEVKTDYFDKKLWLIFRGYVNTATNEIRTKDAQGNTFPYLDQGIIFNSRTSTLRLFDALYPGEAYALDVYPRFSLNLVSGVQVKVYPFFFEEAGEYSEAGELIGDAIYKTGDRCLVLPGSGLTVKILGGAGIVDSFSFKHIGESSVGSLVINKALQPITVNGNGVFRLPSIAIPIDQTEVVRAYVSTLDGVGKPSNWSNSYAIAENQTIVVTCNYPVLSDGLGIVRSDYPDKIAGNTKAKFNPTGVVIYLYRLSDGKIRVFDLNAIVVGASQDFTLSNWDDAVEISALPVPEDLSFGLFAPGVASVSAGVGSGDAAEGFYKAAFAFVYKNVVTSISHDESLGVIPTINTSFATVLSRSAYWAEPVAEASSLREISLSNVSSCQQRSVLNPLDIFRFDPTSFALDDSKLVFRPNAISVSNPGRWVALREPKKPTVELTSVSAAPINSTDDSVILYYDSADVLVRYPRKYPSDERSLTFSFLEKSQIFQQGQGVKLIELFLDGRSIYVGMKYSNRFKVLMTQDITLAVYDMIPGYAFELKIEQDGVGGNSLTFPDYCKFPNGIKPFNSPEPGKIDILSCVCFDVGVLCCALAKGF